MDVSLYAVPRWLITELEVRAVGLNDATLLQLTQALMAAPKVEAALAAVPEPVPPSPSPYRIEAKDDGTWLVIEGTRHRAMLRLEAALKGDLTRAAVEELREKLRGVQGPAASPSTRPPSRQPEGAKPLSGPNHLAHLTRLTIRPFGTMMAVYGNDERLSEGLVTVWDARGWLMCRGLTASDVALLLTKGHLDVEHTVVPGFTTDSDSDTPTVS